MLIDEGRGAEAVGALGAATVAFGDLCGACFDELGKALAENFVEGTGGADEFDFVSDDVALGAAIHHTDGEDEGILRIVHAAG